MAKRFTDTDKWRKPWYRKLSLKNKVLWQYLLDCCDNAGFIELDEKLVSVDLNTKFTMGEIEDSMGKHLVKIKPFLYWIPKFIQFQYPRGLNVSNNAHRGVIGKLEKRGIDWKFDTFKFLYKINDNLGPSQDLVRTCLGPQDKDKDKDKDKEEKKDWAVTQSKNNIAKEVVDFLNQKTGRHHAHSKTSMMPIVARFNDGYAKKDMFKVIEYKVHVDDFFQKNPELYRPSTLFNRSKFETYLEQVRTYEAKTGKGCLHEKGRD